MFSETSHDTGDQHYHNGRLWRAMQALRRQPRGETIHDLLDENTKPRIAIKDMWIEVVIGIHVRMYMLYLFQSCIM